MSAAPKLPSARQTKIDEIKEPLLAILVDAVEDKTVPITTAILEAAVAAISAAACVVALLPDPRARKLVGGIIFEGFEAMVEKRRAEICSGDFDQARWRARN